MSHFFRWHFRCLEVAKNIVKCRTKVLKASESYLGASVNDILLLLAANLSSVYYIFSLIIDTTVHAEAKSA